MSGSINKVILVGNVGRDPEIRSMNSGDRVCNLSLATSERWKDRNTGDQQERTEWHRVVIFDQKLVDVCEKYVKKGSKLFIEGQLQTRKWTDQQGVEKYSTEVVLDWNGSITLLSLPPIHVPSAIPTAMSRACSSQTSVTSCFMETPIVRISANSSSRLRNET